MPQWGLKPALALCLDLVLHLDFQLDALPTDLFLPPVGELGVCSVGCVIDMQLAFYSYHSGGEKISFSPIFLISVISSTEVTKEILRW